MPSVLETLEHTAGFVSDGCTWFFQSWRGIDLLPCCEAHDLSWFENVSRDFGAWIVSNFELSSCFVSIGAWELAIPAFLATCTVGFGLFYLWRKKSNVKQG